MGSTYYHKRMGFQGPPETILSFTMAVNKSIGCSNLLNIVSFNMHGYHQGSMMLNSLCYKYACDILMLQEHWLTPDKLCKFNIFRNDFVIYSASSMDNILRSKILSGRPFRGNAILIRKSLYNLFTTKSVVASRDRYMIVLLDKLLLINVYLPNCKSSLDRDELVTMFEELQQDLTGVRYEYGFCGGDMNTDCTLDSPLTKLINDKLQNLGFILCNSHLEVPSHIDFTFSVEGRNAYSYIDHIYITDSLAKSVISLEGIHDIDNFSDHLPIRLKFKNDSMISSCPSINKEIDASIYSNNLNYRLDWVKSEKRSYYELTKMRLFPIWNSLNEKYVSNLIKDNPDLSQSIINNIYDDIAKILLESSLNTILKRGNKKSEKFWWNAKLRDEKQNSIACYQQWNEAGRPSHGPEAEAKIEAHKSYKKSIFNVRKTSEKVITDKLQNNLLNTNKNKFWRCWKGCFNNKNTVENINVDGLSNNLEIANHLASNFKKACTPNSDLYQQKFKEKYFSNKRFQVTAEYSDLITIESVKQAIDNSQCNKSPGFDNLTIEHIKYAHESLTVILCSLFNIMLSTGLVPDNFGIGVTTAIPKFKGSKKFIQAEDFRGITINPIISKVFELCLKGFIDCKTSDRQFGFKEKVGCNNAIHSLRKVINYFNKRKSTINLGVIDLKKAFDKCNIYGILCTLQNKNVNVNVINTLENWFGKNYTYVKWSGTRSEKIPLISGVKQGSTISPLLFSIFVDVLLDKLAASGYGCYINYNCFNSFIYADDIILISISVTDLQLLLNVCNNVFKELDLPINALKSHCMRVGPRFNFECEPLILQGNSIKWVDNIKYLGVTIVKSCSFRCLWDDSKAKYYISVNTIIGRIGTNGPIDVLLELIKSQALPALMYGIIPATLSNKDMKSFSKAYDSVFSKIFHSFDKNTIAYCQWYCGFWPFSILYEYQRYQFLNSLAKSNKLSNRTDIDSIDYFDYRNIMSKYGILSEDSHAKVVFRMWKYCEMHLP